MKRIVLILCVISGLMAQDAAGQYKLTGVDVLYTFIARENYTLTVTDAYGIGITMPVAEIPGGAPFTTQAMQLTDGALSAIGINLNVTLNEDGSGSITEGSYYPDVNTITNEAGQCITLQQVLPVTDEFTYSSMNNMMAAVGMAHPGVNVLGLPGISGYAGTQMGGLELSSSLTFEDFPMFPEHPTICDPSGTDCFPFTVGDIDGSGTLEIYPDVNLLGIPEYVPGGAPLTGLTAGYFLDDQCVEGTSPGEEGSNCNSGPLTSVYGPLNTDPDFVLEWHGVDGANSTLGFGDDEEIDEDGDGTWFDRLLGIPGVTATFMNPACGFNQPIYGDVTEAFEAAGLGDCVDYVDSSPTGYLMDPSGALATWGNFLTANAAGFSGCLAQGADMATCGALYGDDDSGYDFNGTSGRLTMNFDIPCVPIIEAREVVAEFIAVGGECDLGDINADGGINVLDVVGLVQIVLGGGDDVPCNADINADGGINVLDVVGLVQMVLGGRVDEATTASFDIIGNEVIMTANGYVGAVQMTLSHDKGFQLDLTDNAFAADYKTTGNTTTLIIVAPEGNVLFSANNEFNVESVIAASNSENYLDVKLNVPSNFAISAAYPNPFNPTTQMTLALSTQADVSVKVFNMAGQLVDVIAEGQMDKGSYSLTWDGTNASSGVYFVQTEVGSEVHNQKIMLVK